MKSKTIIILFVMGLFLFASQESRAIILTRMGGEIYVETGTTYGGILSKESATGWGASTGVYTASELLDDSTGVGAYGYATANESVSGCEATFSLSSTAQSANGLTGAAFETYALVRSGSLPGDRLQFMATAEAGEDGMGVQLTAEAILAGTLNSTGLSFLTTMYESGIVDASFNFKVYTEGAVDPFMELPYNMFVQNDGSTGLMTKSVALPEYLGSVTDSSTLCANDIFEIEFEQLVVATVTPSIQCSASGFIHSIDGVSINLTADAIPLSDSPAPVPEPASFLMLGIGLIGVGLLDKIKKIFPKKSFKA